MPGDRPEKGYRSDYFWSTAIAVLTIIAVLVYPMIDETGPAESPWLREDNIIENAQAVMFLIGALGILIAGLRSEVIREGGAIWRYWGIAFWFLLLFVFAGEEISWGQRIIGWQTPDWPFFADNVQDQTNLHNHELLQQTKGTLIKRFMIIFGMVMPIAAVLPLFKGLMRYFAFPVLQLHYVSVFVGAYLVYANLVYSREEFGWGPIEYAETFFAFGLMMFGVHGAIIRDSIFGIDRDGDA